MGQHWRGIASTVGVNWLVKPFSMALLAWIFIAHLFRPWLPADQIASYTAGLILLAAAPCTAMVFVWSNLVDGEPHFTLSQVALNDTIMVVAFAPLVGLLLGLSSITVPWDTLILSVVLYIVVPVIVAQLWRAALLRQGGPAALSRMLSRLAPLSLCALLLTLVLLFGLQGEQIMRQPLVILLLAVPIIIQVYFNAGLAYWLNRKLGVEWCVAGPSALIGASNFFELAVATAIALFGFQSGAALATVVGVLIEVPVMLSVVRIVRRSRGWYERGQARGMKLTARAASPADAEAIAMIYNEGIADRIGTFETEPRSTAQIAAWFDGRHPIIVVEEGREIVAFASTSAYRAARVTPASRNSRSMSRAIAAARAPAASR